MWVRERIGQLIKIMAQDLQDVNGMVVGCASGFEAGRETNRWATLLFNELLRSPEEIRSFRI